MVVQSAEIGFAGFLARWIGRTSGSRRAFETAFSDNDCSLDKSGVCAIPTLNVETVAKTNSANRTIGFDKLFIELRLVCRKPIPILLHNPLAIRCQEDPFVGVAQIITCLVITGGLAPCRYRLVAERRKPSGESNRIKSQPKRAIAMGVDLRSNAIDTSHARTCLRA